MPVLINYNICDKGQGCPVIPSCPTGAWNWNDDTKQPEVNNELCNDCNVCIKVCPARAVLKALDESGLKKLEQEMDRYSVKREELFSELRFNVEEKPDSPNMIDSSRFENDVLKHEGFTLLEFWSGSYASRCTLNAPAYRNLILDKYKEKVRVKKILYDDNQDLAKEYGISTIPTILLFNNGKMVDYIAGYSSISETEALRDRLASTLEREIQMGSC